ncbi:hypothetical protein [Massilia sp. CF038]|uniref:hypothetical protein n=1 Tax=Massilia sp. CF038 TaxID=1881045 RepID=UPI0009207F38|nr:hypothetical protein [Massilia sp. CF038]SHG71431.1 hypothetical protein SAMN05428948_1732 [Massilia sp. CF038]
MDRARTNPQRGAVLLAVVGIVMVLSLAVLAVFALQANQRTLEMSASGPAQMAVIDHALAEFVARHRRLPCPANGTIRSGLVNAGTEAINLSTGQCVPATQINGVVPWVTLSLSEDQARDAWNQRISYRVQPALASNLLTLMNMSWCDPAGSTNGVTGAANACSPAPCSGNACMHPNNYLYGKGLQVQDGNGNWLNQPAPAWAGQPAAPPVSTGAPYVLVMHGANSVGAYDANGILHGGSAGSSELPNRNGLALTGATVFIDRAPVAVSGASYFDDILSHPAITTVLERARLAARSPH